MERVPSSAMLLSRSTARVERPSTPLSAAADTEEARGECGRLTKVWRLYPSNGEAYEGYEEIIRCTLLVYTTVVDLSFVGFHLRAREMIEVHSHERSAHAHAELADEENLAPALRLCQPLLLHRLLP